MDFLVKVDSAGNFHFADKGQEFVYNKFIDLYSRSGKYFKFTLSENIGHTTDNQINLFKRLIMIITETSGSTYNEIYKELHQQFAPKATEPGLFGPETVEILDVHKMDRKQFSEFFERCVSMTNEMFNTNLQIHYDDQVGMIMSVQKPEL